MSNKPTIIVSEDTGFHNSSSETVKRLEASKSYQDLSTICIVPCLKSIPARVVQNWLSLASPMNQKFIRIFAYNMEVGTSYSETIDMILNNEELKNWKYILTLEHDNMPPADGLLKLYENMDKYDAIGGIYFTKGAGGQPMSYGNPSVFPINFIPFLPPPDSVTRCNGLGMGFTLFKLEMLKDKRLPRPLFQTTMSYTQDLKFFEAAGRLGYKFACDSRVKVGHYDLENDIVW